MLAHAGLRPSSCSRARRGRACASSRCVSAPIRFGDVVAHLVHHVMGHVAVQRPVAGLRRRRTRSCACVPTGTSTVVSGRCADAGRRRRRSRRPRTRGRAGGSGGDPSGRGCRGGCARARRSRRRAAAVAGNALPLNVSTLKSFIAQRIGPRARRSESSTRAPSARSRDRRGARSAASGWTTNMPIMPSAICVISSKCGWYMNVPARSSVNSYLNVSPGCDRASASGRRRRPCRSGTSMPCQCTRRRLGQPVGDVDADAIALGRLDRRAGRRAVVAPRFDVEARRDLVLHRLARRGETPSRRRRCFHGNERSVRHDELRGLCFRRRRRWRRCRRGVLVRALRDGFAARERGTCGERRGQELSARDRHGDLSASESVSRWRAGIAARRAERDAAAQRGDLGHRIPVAAQRIEVLLARVGELAARDDQLERVGIHRVVVEQRLVDDLLAQRQDRRRAGGALPDTRRARATRAARASARSSTRGRVSSCSALRELGACACARSPLR